MSNGYPATIFFLILWCPFGFVTTPFRKWLDLFAVAVGGAVISDGLFCSSKSKFVQDINVKIPIKTVTNSEITVPEYFELKSGISRDWASPSCMQHPSRQFQEIVNLHNYRFQKSKMSFLRHFSSRTLMSLLWLCHSTGGLPKRRSTPFLSSTVSLIWLLLNVHLNWPRRKKRGKIGTILK